MKNKENLKGMIRMDKDKLLRDSALKLVRIAVRQLLHLGYPKRFIEDAIKQTMWGELDKK